MVFVFFLIFSFFFYSEHSTSHKSLKIMSWQPFFHVAQNCTLNASHKLRVRAAVSHGGEPPAFRPTDMKGCVETVSSLGINHSGNKRRRRCVLQTWDDGKGGVENGNFSVQRWREGERTGGGGVSV